MNKNKIQEQIEKLEKDKEGYLEVNNKAGVRRKEKQIQELEDKLELSKLKDIKQDLNIYKKFVKSKYMQREFENFYIVELAKD